MKRLSLLLFVCFCFGEINAQAFMSDIDVGGSSNDAVELSTLSNMISLNTGYSTSVCVGSTLNLSTSVTNAGTSPVYSWVSSNTSIATVTTGSSTSIVTGLAAGTFTITVTYTSSTGMSSAITSTITVKALPTPTITGSTTVCGGANIKLTGTPTVASGSTFDASNSANFTWASSNTTAANVSSGVATAVTVTGTTAGGSTTITYTIKDNFGCSGSGTYAMTANPQPSYTSAIAAGSICSQYPATINLTGLTPSSTFNLDYNVANGATQTFTGITSNASGVGSFSTINIPSNGTNNVFINYVKITNTTTNCTNVGLGAISTTLTIKRGPQPTISGSTSVCAGSTIILTGTPNLKSGSSVTTLTWASSNTSAATVNSNTGVVSGIAVGSTTISYYVKDNNNCDSTATKTITVNALPTVAIAAIESSCTANDNKVLTGATVSLTASGSGGSSSYTTYTWDNSLGTGATKTPTVTATTSYNVTVTDSNGCTASNLQTETLITAPTFSNTKIDDPCQVGVGSITVTLTGGTPTYTIAACGTTIAPTPSAGTYVTVSGSPATISTSGGSKTFSNLPGNATYKFTITDTNGCPAQ